MSSKEGTFWAEVFQVPLDCLVSRIGGGELNGETVGGKDGLGGGNPGITIGGGTEISDGGFWNVDFNGGKFEIGGTGGGILELKIIFCGGGGVGKLGLETEGGNTPFTGGGNTGVSSKAFLNGGGMYIPGPVEVLELETFDFFLSRRIG